MPTKISMAREDIDNGTPSSPSCCAIALAFKRCNPDAGSVSVDGTSIEWLDSYGTMMIAVLPESAISLIDAFDSLDKDATEEDRAAITPIDFEVEFAPSMSDSDEDDADFSEDEDDLDDLDDDEEDDDEDWDSDSDEDWDDDEL